jgi:hypothetical protein
VIAGHKFYKSDYPRLSKFKNTWKAAIKEAEDEAFSKSMVAAGNRHWAECKTFLEMAWLSSEKQFLHMYLGKLIDKEWCTISDQQFSRVFYGICAIVHGLVLELQSC